ncbi:MAG: glycosyltransferase family 2 protein [Candidatus Omnitrophica bacterium]|nr:glycosyltransferase family 2 protein [Candidatus Omnitrophota bacterium]
MLSVIILNYETLEYTLKCLRSVFKHPPACDFEVLVVDNGSQDGLAEAIRREAPSAVFLPMRSNVGFGHANNVAARRAKGDTLLFLNGDTRVLQGSLDGMIERMGACPDVAILGPKQLDSWGRLQLASGIFPSFRRVLFDELTAFRALRSPGALLDDAPEKKRGFEAADWISSSCFMIRRRVFLELGGWDENFFLYFEDIDLCRRARDAGWHVHASFDMRTSMIHHGGVSAVKNMLRTELEYRRSQLRFIKKYYDRRGLWKLRLFLFVKAAGQMAPNGLIFLSAKMLGRESKISRGRLLLAKKTIELAWGKC